MVPPPIGHVGLAGAAVFAIVQNPDLQLTLPVGALGIFLVYGVMGVITSYVCSQQSENLFSLASSLVETVPLGLIATEFALQSPTKLSDIGYVFAVIGVLPIIGELFIDACKIQNVKDFAIYLNGFALIAIGILDKKPCIAGLGALSIVNHTSQSYIADLLDIPRHQIEPLGYSMTALLTYMILNDKI